MNNQLQQPYWNISPFFLSYIIFLPMYLIGSVYGIILILTNQLVVLIGVTQ